MRGDILGLPVTVATRNQKTLDFAEAMREVEAEAQAAGQQVYVSVQARKGYLLGESYATLTLNGLLEVLARAYPDSVELSTHNAGYHDNPRAREAS